MGITQHEHGTDNVAAIVNLGLARGNVGRPGAGLMPIRGHSGVQGGAEMGAYATAFPGGVEVDADLGRELAEQYGFPIGDRPGSPRRRWSRRAAGAISTSSTRPAATSSRCCPIPSWSSSSWPGSRCGCTRTSCCRARCWSIPARSWCCCPRRRATSNATAAPRPRPSGASRSARRSPVGDPARCGASGRSSSISRRASIPTAPISCVRVRSGDPRRDRTRRAVVRGRRDAAHHGRRGAVGRHAAVRRRHVPDGRRQGPLPRGRAVEPDVPEGSFLLSTRRGKQFNTMVHADATRSPVRCATRCSWRRRTSPGSGCATAIGSSSGPTTVRWRRACTRARCAPATCRCSSPRATCCCGPGGATPRRGYPTTTRSSRWKPRAVSPDTIGPNAIGPNALVPTPLVPTNCSRSSTSPAPRNGARSPPSAPPSDGRAPTGPGSTSSTSSPTPRCSRCSRRPACAS